MTLCFISGLGADERVFQKLQLPQSWSSQHISWIDPLYNESLSYYAHRLSETVNVNDDLVLIGLSFGGMIAVEMNKFLKPELTILISGIATKYELPAAARFFAKTKLNKLVPASLLKIPNPVTYWLFGTEIPEEKRLVRQAIANTSSHFLNWAIGEIINWKNELRPDNLVHIHGTKDRLLPVTNTNADIQIVGGGHLMVYSKAEEISRILIKTITEFQ